MKNLTPVASGDKRKTQMEPAAVAVLKAHAEAMPMEVVFTASEEERQLISKIAKRAGKMAPYPTMDCQMDIEAAHCNGNPLRLAELLAANDFNFAHDVFGIRHALNRRTGKMENHFLPRYFDRTARKGA